ncbi:DUF2399 domain-containing protein [Streptomyces hydrogenans]|uniref:DUF2399 domain-containing protein n=1 Tax=Streptomyces hydrogenans TaxID=1873719 RepID=UPI003827AB34
MRNERLDERLSDEELGLFVAYLHRFANHGAELRYHGDFDGEGIRDDLADHTKGRWS